MLVALLALALLAALLAGRRNRHVLTGAVAVALFLGYIADGLPGFFLHAPAGIASALTAFGGFWGRMVGIAALGAPVLAFAVADRAAAALRTRTWLSLRDQLPRLRHRTRRLLAGPVALAVFLGAMWFGAVMRMSYDEHSEGYPPSAIGEQAGRLLGDYLLPCLIVAAVIWYQARKAAGGADLVAAGAVCAAAAGAWPEHLGGPQVARFGLGGDVFGALGGTWGEGTAWCAVLLVLPAVTGAVLLLRERTT
jgi:hypothetical protein